MKQYKKIYEIRNMAKDKMESKYGGAILITFLSALLSGMVRLSINSVCTNTMNTVYGMTGSTGAARGISILFDVLLAAAGILMGVMNAGIALYFLNLACGQAASLRDLFYGFRTDSKKFLVISAAIVLCQTICLWPGQYLLQNYLSTHDAKWVLYALAAAGVGLCFYVPISLGIALSFYLILDFPQNSGRETLSLCWRMMRGHRGRLFQLELGFLPLMLLCILSFGVGFLWLEPYMQMSYACFFLDLMNPKSVQRTG